MRYPLLFLAGYLFMLSCSGGRKKNEPVPLSPQEKSDSTRLSNIYWYEVYQTQNMQSGNSNWLNIFALNKTVLHSKDSLAEMLKFIYTKYRNHNHVATKEPPDYIDIFIYAGKKNVIAGDDNWVAKLHKMHGDEIPIINIKDTPFINHTVEDFADENYEKIVNELKKHFEKRNADFCTVNKEYATIVAGCYMQACKKYPDSETQFRKYLKEISDKATAALRKKYDIDEAVRLYMSVAGLRYCH